MTQNSIGNTHRETAIFYTRNILGFIVVLLMTTLLIWRMFVLQVIEYEQHNAKSNHNRIKIQPLPPTRGLIYDNAGTLLAENRPMFMATITKERVKAMDTTLAELTPLLSLDEDDLKGFNRRLKQRRRPYESVPLKFDLTEKEIAQVAVNLHAFPGVAIEAELIRHYPLGELTAHSIGYVGRINSKEAKILDEAVYAGTNYIGKVGIEKSYEDILLGKVGHQRVETNARGKILRVIDQTAPYPGKNVRLYLDMPTQLAATEALGDKRGAVVALEPKSGGILAFVSTPSFNPNLFVTGIDHKTFNALNTSRQRPLFNRAIKGQYPPGSTIKPMVGLAGLHYNIVDWDYKIYDIGYFQLKGVSHRYRDWKKRGHGRVDLERAIVESCDTYFYELSHKLTIDRLSEFLGQFNLGQHSQIDVPGERRGVLPSREWKRNNRNLPWYPGETLITGIGQGFMLTTPVQLAQATAIMANRGKFVTPRMVSHTDNVPYLPPQNQHIEITDSTQWEKVIDSMEKVVHSPRGTAKRAGDGKVYKVAGKTGTAQVIAIKQDEEYDADKIDEWHRDHALFIAFAPVDDPMIVVAIIVENAGGGGANAAPVARTVLDSYLLPRLETLSLHSTTN